MQIRVANDWINKHNTANIEIGRILGFEHLIRNIRNVDAAIALACNVRLSPLQAKSIKEILVKAHELFRQANFVYDIRDALREADADWLFDVEHVCEVRPAVWIHNWRECAGLLDEWTIFLEQATQR